MKDVSEFVPGKKYRRTNWNVGEYVFFIGISTSGEGVFENKYHDFQTFPVWCPENWREYREPIKGSFWVNVYRTTSANCSHPSREEADRLAYVDRIACIEVHYTEGDGL